eukprot:CAMPEP_0201660506 /NCGR_PEP_ID=MMETSP0494-20130426/3144_1 /ASSEMBLY_ACC=CAM_ASM_000839 /TAXON_ID=420259 /ORGANISM="Thalassiosira gravida, Strain GMp14c1" /LENGTH=693 /DNA_ID=CAMNT_0048138409 /DNA_START=134 /DNA_END=2215 /DNA_ORIENTATION=-
MLILLLMLLRSSQSLLVPTSTRCSYFHSINRSPKTTTFARTSGLSSSTRPSTTIYSASADDDDDDDDDENSRVIKCDDERESRTALLLMSPHRLRLRDNLALTKAAELGPDGLAICLVWPYNDSKTSSSSSSSSSSHQLTQQLTPVKAFGYAAVHALNDALGELGQKLWIIPSQNDDHDHDHDRGALLSSIARTVRKLNPSHVVVDVDLLDRHHDYASELRNKLQTTNNNDDDDDDDDDENNTSTLIDVVEIMDDGLLIPFDKVPKALGRSRQGGRALRWSTFLSNTMKMQKENDVDFDKPIWEISSLPPPMHTMDDDVVSNNVLSTTTTSSSSMMMIPRIETFPTWAKQLLSDWGDINEEEAILRATSITITTTGDKTRTASVASSLAEKGSENTKLSPYLRWGVISPQRASKAGVRTRDLLWRDWSRVSYGLLNSLRRGDAVLEFMDRSCRRRFDSPRSELNDSNNDNNNNSSNMSEQGTTSTSEDELFNLWCVGNTGSHLVDAGMRQLWNEGWMPRRIRLLSAACLVEGLGIDWKRGRDWFERTLVDHDAAINEVMWQNAGLCGVDPFYSGIAWEAPPNGWEEEEYAEKWIGSGFSGSGGGSGEGSLAVWPSYLKTWATKVPPLQIVDGAESRREVLRAKGVYKAARTIGNAGVRVAWKGLANNNSATNNSVEEGEVMGVGFVPVHELRI